MNETKLQQKIANYRRAVERLHDALVVDSDDELAIDGTIQRFEFVFELAWKTIKAGLALEGIEAGTPREALKQAFAAGWIADEEAWLGMLADRNVTSHVYDQSTAARIYENIRGYEPEFQRMLAFLDERFRTPQS